MPRIRDYKAEYARRIENAAARGLTRSQARGHARQGENPARVAPKLVPDDRLEEALKLLRRGGNRSSAAKEIGISPERFRRFLRENVEVSGRGRSLKITDNRPREVKVASRGKWRVVRLRDFPQTSLNGRHRAAIGKFLTSNDADALSPFIGQFVIDAKGKRYPLETEPNALYRLAAEGEGVFHDIYRLIH